MTRILTINIATLIDYIIYASKIEMIIILILLFPEPIVTYCAALLWRLDNAPVASPFISAHVEEFTFIVSITQLIDHAVVPFGSLALKSMSGITFKLRHIASMAQWGLAV